MKYTLYLFSSILMSFVLGCSEESEQDKIDKKIDEWNDRNEIIDSINKHESQSLIKRYSAITLNWEEYYTAYVSDWIVGDTVEITGTLNDIETESEEHLLIVCNEKLNTKAHIIVHSQSFLNDIAERAPAEKRRHKGCFIFRLLLNDKNKDGHEVSGDLVDYYIFKPREKL